LGGDSVSSVAAVREAQARQRAASRNDRRRCLNCCTVGAHRAPLQLGNPAILKLSHYRILGTEGNIRTHDEVTAEPALQLKRMAEKLIGSLIYGEHELPKKSRSWKAALKVPLTIGLVLIFIGGVAYKFANFREERRVRLFIEAIQNGQYEAAYQNWDADARYTTKDFLQDWGKDGYYTKGMHDARVTDSNGKGSSVVVYVTIDSLKHPVALRVDKETLKISFSPISKYPSP